MPLTSGKGRLYTTDEDEVIFLDRIDCISCLINMDAINKEKTPRHETITKTESKLEKVDFLFFSVDKC